MPVDTTPRMGMGCDGDCNFYFEIEHQPAKMIFQTIKRQEEGKGNQIFVSKMSRLKGFDKIVQQIDWLISEI